MERHTADVTMTAHEHTRPRRPVPSRTNIARGRVVFASWMYRFSALRAYRACNAEMHARPPCVRFAQFHEQIERKLAREKSFFVGRKTGVFVALPHASCATKLVHFSLRVTNVVVNVRIR